MARLTFTALLLFVASSMLAILFLTDEGQRAPAADACHRRGAPTKNPDDEERRSGERISLMWISANRDPTVNSQPDRVDLHRDTATNLLFGSGIHRCLGEPLARLNLRVGVNELLRRTARFESASLEEPARHHYPSNGLSALPVRLTPAHRSER